MTEIGSSLRILEEAVDVIVAQEKAKFPSKEDAFWEDFHDVLLAEVIRRHEEIL